MDSVFASEMGPRALAGVHRLAGPHQDAHHAESFLATCFRLSPLGNAVEKMLTLEFERLMLLHRNRKRFSTDYCGGVPRYIHRVRVQKQLALPWRAIIKHNHGL